MRDEAARTAAFINREIDGDVCSSAAGSRRKRTWPAARRSVSMTSNMLIESLHSYIAHAASEIITAARERNRGKVRQMRLWCLWCHWYALILVKNKSSVVIRCCQSCVCAQELGTPCAWFIQQWRAQKRGRQDTTRSFPISPHYKHTWKKQLMMILFSSSGRFSA